MSSLHVTKMIKTKAKRRPCTIAENQGRPPIAFNDSVVSFYMREQYSLTSGNPPCISANEVWSVPSTDQRADRDLRLSFLLFTGRFCSSHFVDHGRVTSRFFVLVQLPPWRQPESGAVAASPNSRSVDLDHHRSRIVLLPNQTRLYRDLGYGGCRWGARGCGSHPGLRQRCDT